MPVPTGWDAESFVDSLREFGFDGRDSILSGHGISTFSRAVYRDRWVYVRLLHSGVFSYTGMFNDPSLPDDGLELLHDLDGDPHMMENPIEQRLDVADQLRADLDEWLVEQVSNRWYCTRSPEARSRDPLTQMCSEAPFLYVDPASYRRSIEISIATTEPTHPRGPVPGTLLTDRRRRCLAGRYHARYWTDRY